MKEGYKQTSIGLIPNTWSIKEIGQIAEVTAGGTPSTNIPQYWNGNIPWMNSGEINLRKVKSVEGRITEEGLRNSSTKMIPVNSVLMALAGQGKTRGKVAINEIEVCTNQSLAAIIPNKNHVNHEFLFQNLESRYFEIRKMSSGDGGRGGLNLAIIRAIKVVLPPLPEQQKIAEILSTVDEKIAVIEEQIEQNRQLKKGFMQRLLTRGIGHTQFKDSPLGEIPESWEVKRISDLCDKVTDGEHLSPIFLMEGYPILSAKDVRENGVDFKEAKFISEGAFKLSLKRCNPEFNDVLIVSRGATIGRATLNKSKVPFALMGSVILLKPSGTYIKGEFLIYLIQRKEFQNQVLSLSGSSAQQAIYLKDIKSSFLPIPPLEEQEKIATILSTVDEKIEVLQEKKSYYQELKKGLMQQLLTGKLRVNQSIAEPEMA